MMAFRNRPQFADSDTKVRRYVHSPLTVDHNGIQASILKTGKVVISVVSDEKSDQDEIQWDEVTIPASLIFKLANLLRATRKIEFVALSELDGTEQVDESESK